MITPDRRAGIRQRARYFADRVDADLYRLVGVDIPTLVDEVDGLSAELEEGRLHHGEFVARLLAQIPDEPDSQTSAEMLVIRWVEDRAAEAKRLQTELSQMTAARDTLAELYKELDGKTTDDRVIAEQQRTSRVFSQLTQVEADRDRLTDGATTALDALRRGQHNLGRETLAALLDGGEDR